MNAANDALVRQWLATCQAEVSRDCGECDGTGQVHDGDPIPFDCGACPTVRLEGRAAVVRVEGCTCAGQDNGVGIEHEPGCGDDLVDMLPAHLAVPIMEGPPL